MRQVTRRHPTNQPTTASSDACPVKASSSSSISRRAAPVDLQAFAFKLVHTAEEKERERERCATTKGGGSNSISTSCTERESTMPIDLLSILGKVDVAAAAAVVPAVVVALC